MNVYCVLAVYKPSMACMCNVESLRLKIHYLIFIFIVFPCSKLHCQLMITHYTKQFLEFSVSFIVHVNVMHDQLRLWKCLRKINQRRTSYTWDNNFKSIVQPDDVHVQMFVDALTALSTLLVFNPPIAWGPLEGSSGGDRRQSSEIRSTVLSRNCARFIWNMASSGRRHLHRAEKSPTCRDLWGEQVSMWRIE
jgi:hypothetical protein